MQQLNAKETKEVSGGFVVAIPLLAGSLWELLTGAAVLTGAAMLTKTLDKRENKPSSEPQKEPKEKPPFKPKPDWHIHPHNDLHKEKNKK